VTHQLVLTLTWTFFPLSEVATTWQTDSTVHKLKPRLFHKSAHLWGPFCRLPLRCELHLTVLSDFQVCCHFWAVPSAFQPYNSHFKVQMASSHHNSSTPVSLLGTLFNTISCFSDQMAYSPNAPRCSRWIHQRGRSSLRSPSSTIQPGRTVSPVSGPSIISADNDSNWEDAPTTNSITNLTANRPTSSTCLQSKPRQSDNTNKQLAEVLGWLANTLNSNQTPGPNTNLRKTKACILNTFSSTKPDKLNNFLFQCHLYFHANPV